MESILRGKPKQYNFIFDAQGNIIDEEEIEEGKEGNDVLLTIDIELQKKIATSATVHHPLMHRLAGLNAPCDLSGSAWSYRIRFDSSRSETDGAGRSNEIKE